jgi:hypothetical protein
LRAEGIDSYFLAFLVLKIVHKYTIYTNVNENVTTTTVDDVNKPGEEREFLETTSWFFLNQLSLPAQITACPSGPPSVSLTLLPTLWPSHCLL